ncbi:MAG TPA: ComEC/Rec2 family competence protein [Polyangia bacterium]|nr:ComEC/Rec2 family competence protein [Polyangia bacterium]
MLRPRELALFAFWFALPLALLLMKERAGAEARLAVSFIDVGQGDAALITSPTGKSVLVDGGPPESAAALTEFVRARARQPLDLVLLTHRHVDHLGGLESLIRSVGTRLFLDSSYPHPTPAYRRLVRLLEERHVPVREAIRGRRVDLGDGAILELLGPPEPALAHTRSDVNSNSVVARLDWRRLSVLFAADAEAPAERWLLAERTRLRARVLKVAHHGSRYSSTLRFLRAVAPEIAVVSCGAGNDYGHPHPLALRRLAQVGARVYRTDERGDVLLTSDGDRLEIATTRGPKEARR